jgi:hypothetical protein
MHPILSKLLAWNEGGFYEFTPLGKIPVGALSLRLFNEVQEPLLLESNWEFDGIFSVG